MDPARTAPRPLPYGPPPPHPPPTATHSLDQRSPSSYHPSAPPASHHHQHQQHQQQQHQQPQLQHPNQHQHQHQQRPPPPYPAPPGFGPSLPPIQPLYAHPAPGPEQNSLPPFRHPSTTSQAPHDGRDPPEYYQHNQHSRSDHATPAPVNHRSFSHDSSHQQRTPSTPAQPGPYPPGSALDGAQTPSLHMEHAAQQPYPPPNGLPHGLPTPGLHDAPQGPRPPLSQGPPPQGHDPHGSYPVTPGVEAHSAYPTHPHGSQQQMYQPGYGPASSFGPASSMSSKRKPVRAQQACEQCRQRKQKCDEGNPCSFCKENNITCNYRDTPPAKTDKNMERVLNYLETTTEGIGMVRDKLDELDSRLRRVEAAGLVNNSGPQPPAPLSIPVEEPAPVRKRQLDDHRTGPHKLIVLWPNVRPLLKNAGVDITETYVMEAEDRGVLRLYGRGEGIDEQDGTQPGGPASPARSDDSADTAATLREGLWGRGFSCNAQPSTSRASLAGGLKADGSLDLDQSTLNSLFDSYMRHIHIMHPFLDRGRIRRLFDTFIQRYSPGRQRMGFAVGSNSESERPLKRQRSNGSNGTTAVSSESGKNLHQTERSPANAIVYLVLALGQVCAHKDPLPGIVPDGKANVNQAVSHSLTGNPGFVGSSPSSSSIKPSPVMPKSIPSSHPTPPDVGMRVEPRSRRSSFDGGAGGGSRNIDVIPGIAYYAKAAEILGDQGDGNDLVHAQMFLLAGLYKGQLARVKESMSWLSMAGRACQILLDRYKLYNHNYWATHGDVRSNFEAGLRQIKDKRHNLIVLASWSCLQLESDILAELKFPSSGIQGIEEYLLMPHNLSEDESYDNVQTVEGDMENYNNILVFYTAQMFLRKRLNQVHREIYGDDFQHQPLSAVQAMVQGHQQTIQDWRSQLPPLLRWNDWDPPASDILAARLRAKYWGARYVINRPFLDYALHIMPQVKEGRPVEEVAVDAHGKPRHSSEVLLFKAIGEMGERAVWEASKRCIDSALQSTVALDGVRTRLIVTNINGTAHAQFGNMLVLAATYYTPWLRDLVPARDFETKLDRTIAFLRRLAPISPTCNIDCGILEKIHRLLFGIPADAKLAYENEIEPGSASHSFSL